MKKPTKLFLFGALLLAAFCLAVVIPGAYWLFYDKLTFAQLFKKVWYLYAASAGCSIWAYYLTNKHLLR